MKNKENNKNFKINTPDEQGIEIISPEERNYSSQLIIENDDQNDSISIDKERIQVKKSGNLVIGSLNLALDPIKRRNERYYKNNFWHIIADLFLVLLIITLAFSLFYINRWGSDDKVQLNIQSANQELISGSLNSFELLYKSEIKASKSKVLLSVPENFIIESVSPANLFNKENNSFDLGAIEPGSSGKIKVNGFIWGEKDDQQKISFTFNCDQCGKKGFSKSLFYGIDESAIDVNLVLSDFVYSSSEFDSKILLKNNTNQDIKNINIKISDDLSIKSSSQQFNSNHIFIDKISALDSTEIDFSAEVNKESLLQIEPIISLNILDKDFQIRAPKNSLSVKKSNLLFEINTNKTVKSDNELIPYTIKIKNEDKLSLKNIKIKLSSSNNNFLLNSLNLDNKNNNTQIIDKDIIINDLLSGEELTMNLNSSFSGKQNLPNQELGLSAQIEYELNSQLFKQKTNSNKTKLSSISKAIVSAYYYSPQGDQLGVGPLPPAVDMATNYWIFLEFNNEGNSLSDFVLSAELPSNVYFSNNKRVLDGSVNYAELSKRLLWQIDEIPASGSKQRANIEISLIPESSDLGKIPTLLKNIKFTATDNFTKQEISGSVSDINTDLKNDKLSSGKGRVINLR